MNIKLILIFLKRLNFLKAINFFKVYFSYLISSTTKKVFRWGKPLSISIEPTTNCNLSCPECPVGNEKLARKGGNINIELFNKIIDSSSKYLLNVFLYFQGEPFLNKNIFKMIKYADKKGVYTVTSTNGHFLTKDNSLKIIESGLDKLIISLDGTTQNIYSQYRVNGDLSQVIEGIKNLVKIKEEQNSKKPFVELQFLVLKTNEYQIDEIKKLAKKLNVEKLSLKSAQVYDYENDNTFIPNNKKHNRYKKENGKWMLKNKLKNRCWRLWNSVVITWNGDVLPCCYDKNAKYSFCNIQNNDLQSLVKNKNFKTFANNVLTNRKGIDICQNCSE